MNWDKLVEHLIKLKNPIYIILIILIYFMNEFFDFIKEKYLLGAICIILISLVLLKDTIYKIIDRICKRDENIEKEKTKQKIEKYKLSKPYLEENTEFKSADDRNGDDCKIYEIKHSERK